MDEQDVLRFDGGGLGPGFRAEGSEIKLRVNVLSFRFEVLGSKVVKPYTLRPRFQS